MNAITLNLNTIMQLTSEQFYQLCQENPELELERTANGELVVMPPTGGETGKTNSNINAQLWLWNEQTQLGEVFDSSTGFILPNGAIRSPDAAWLEKSRWLSLTDEQKEKFIPLCPDFAIEILSPSDILKKTEAKMEEYINNGCHLGWLIDRQKHKIEIYRPNQTVEVLQSPQSVSGENVLPQFNLNLQKVWS